MSSMVDLDKQIAYARSRRTVGGQVRAYLLLQVCVFREFGEVMGWIGKFRREPPPGLSTEKRDEIFSLLLDPEVHPIRKAFGAVILDYYDPTWRQWAPRGVLGNIVGRNTYEVQQWRNAVLARDGHTCCHCGSTKRLDAHHIVQWAHAPHLRVEVDNGKTLCRRCHMEVHH